MLRSLVLPLLLVGASVRATRFCDECIPLDELLTPNYGVDFSLNGIVYATSPHNRSTQTLAQLLTNTSSESDNEALFEYRKLLSDYHEASNDSSFEFPGTALGVWEDFRHSWKHNVFKPGEQTVLGRPFGFLQRLICNMLATCTEPRKTEPPDLPPEVKRATTIIAAALQAAGVNPSYPRRKTGLQVPMWMTANQTLPFFIALDRLGHEPVDIGWSPMALAGLSQLDLCEVSSEYIPCDDKVIMTVSLSREALVLEVLYVDGMGYHHWHTSASDLGRDPQDPVDGPWITNTLELLHDFEDSRSEKPTYVFVVGAAAEDKMLMRILALDRFGFALKALPEGIAPEHVQAAGAAVLAKGGLEYHGTDCLEDDECLAIRDEADRIAGEPFGGNEPTTSERVHVEL